MDSSQITQVIVHNEERINVDINGHSDEDDRLKTPRKPITNSIALDFFRCVH